MPQFSAITGHSVNIPTQWDVQSFCDQLKLQYKIMIKGERLYVRCGRPIPKIRIDFASNKELSDILKNKRMLLDDNNTSYSIEPYVPPPKVHRCYICQQYDDHIAAHCPNKDKPICFKCGQQHQYNPECQNKTCCVYCKRDHLAGNPSCPNISETRDFKKVQMKQSSVTTTHGLNTNRWTGDSAFHLFDNLETTPTVTRNNSNVNNYSFKLLDTIHRDIQNILQQQMEVNKQLKELTVQSNNQAKEIINIHQGLHEIVCLLLKEVTHIMYSQINSQQKHQIDPFFNRMINYINRKEQIHSLVNGAPLDKSPSQQPKLKSILPSNDTTIHMNKEP